MPTKHKALFVQANDGALFVRMDSIMLMLDSIMLMLVAIADGLPYHLFGDDDTAYMKVTDAIEWCKRERKHHDHDEYDKKIAVMERALEEAKAATEEE